LEKVSVDPGPQAEENRRKSESVSPRVPGAGIKLKLSKPTADKREKKRRRERSGRRNLDDSSSDDSSQSDRSVSAMGNNFAKLPISAEKFSGKFFIIIEQVNFIRWL
jgi:hypothetical protein